MKVTFRLKASELLCVYFIFTAYTQIRLHCTQRTSFVFIEKDVLGLGVGMNAFLHRALSIWWQDSKKIISIEKLFDI